MLRRGIRGHAMARAAIEMAAWALLAERREISLAKLLGGTRERVATGIALGMQPSIDDLLTKVDAAVRAGYRRVKLKIAPGADREPLAAIRAAVRDPDFSLMADANSAYRLADADHLASLDALDLMMIEQPLAWDDLLRHAELQKHLRTPICLDESLTGPDRVEDMVKLGSGQIVNLKPGRVGGFKASLRIHDLCGHHSLPLWCGGMLESGIGRAYNVALASLPGFSLPGDLSPSARYWQRDIVSPEWTMEENGEVEVPQERPGLGCEHQDRPSRRSHGPARGAEIDFIQASALLTGRGFLYAHRKIGNSRSPGEKGRWHKPRQNRITPASHLARIA